MHPPIANNHALRHCVLAVCFWIILASFLSPLAFHSDIDFIQSLSELNPEFGFRHNASMPADDWKARWLKQMDRIPSDLVFSRETEVEEGNKAAIARLRNCLESDRDDCAKNTYKVILGSWACLKMAISTTSQSGEMVWMRSIIRAFNELNYTLLVVDDYTLLRNVYNFMPDVILSIWAEDILVVSCVLDPRCVENYQRLDSTWPDLATIPANEQGIIPVWKLFTISYWGARPGESFWTDQSDQIYSYNPLGNEWTIVPFPYPEHSCIPFSYEQECNETVNASERDEQVVILAKHTKYLFTDRSPTKEMWDRLVNGTELGVKFITSASQLDENDRPLLPGINSTGILLPSEYKHMVGKSKAMLAVGNPALSPSPYVALCAGVPVLIPYYHDTPTPDGWNLFRDFWSQHGPVASLGEPYAYSYHYRDSDMLVEKLRKAISTPIEKFIPESMLWQSVLDTVETFMNRNWRLEALKIIKANRSKIPLLPKNIAEKMRKEGRLSRIKSSQNLTILS
ncbi:hypothetical protein BJ741DRAFT_630173 [Chytriomyces cf. hyalinus JEL632]|nr:hypothetical protein BJ741DRAFT_630173 [Chytriomyces cf. hyalinus JEL632]